MKHLRTDLKEEKKGTAFPFNGMDEQVKPEGKDCTSVDIQFGAQSSQFTYDAEKKVYLKQINNTPQTDGKTGEQLAFTNVFVLETDISVRDEVDIMYQTEVFRKSTGLRKVITRSPICLSMTSPVKKSS